MTEREEEGRLLAQTHYLRLPSRELCPAPIPRQGLVGSPSHETSFHPISCSQG